MDTARPRSGRPVPDQRSIPRGRSAVAGGPYDFRRSREVGGTVLDTTYTDLVRAPDGPAGSWGIHAGAAS